MVRGMHQSSIAKHRRAGAGSDLSLAIGRELRSLRVAKGLTQTSLGAPLTRGFVSAVEHGRTVPSLAALALLVDRLGISLDVFFLRVKAQMTVLYNLDRERRPDPPSRRRR
jgi:transcriptional regulator with XRE-family HTH domain